MLRTTLAALAAIAALGILAPAAHADYVTHSGVRHVTNYSSGDNSSKPPTRRVDINGNPVRGTWINGKFQPNPAGTQHQYTVDGAQQSSPYKSGCNHC